MENQPEEPNHSSYRARNSTRWTKKGQNKTKAEFGTFTMHHNDDNNELDKIHLRFLNLSTGMKLQIMRIVLYTEAMVNALDKIMGNET